MSKKIKIAVVGLGIMGQYHVRTFKELPNVQVIAVSDIDAKIGNKIAKQYNTKFLADYKLIMEERPDCVSIVVPTKFHKEVAMFFLKNKIPVFVEKPLAATAQEAKEIINAAKSKDVILQVGHIERFNPAVRQLISLINNEEFGDILSIIAKRVGLFPPRLTDSNVITDLAVHDLDIIYCLTGKVPDFIFAQGGGLIKGREDHAEILLAYKTFGCFIQVNWVTPIKIRTLSITGTKGYAELNYITQKIDLYKTNSLIAPKKFKEFVAQLGTPKKLEIDMGNEEPLKLELESFITCVKTKSKPLVTGEDGLRAVILSEAAIESLRNSKVIKI